MIPAPNLVIGLLDKLIGLEIPFLIGGSFASSAWGQPRQTNDLDIELVLKKSDVASLFLATKDDFAGSEDQIIDALNSKENFPSIQLLHMEELFKVDLFPVEETEYVLGSFARAVPFELGSGKSYPFKSPEDIVLSKLRWYELGNRVSDKQWNDIVQVLEVQQGRIDEDYLGKWATHFGILDLLEKAWAQAN